MANYTTMKSVYTTSTSAINKSYTCLKDSTAIVMFLGRTYTGSGSVNLNGTALSSISGSSSANYMGILNLKQGDVINFKFQTSATNSYRLFGIILHEDGAF